MGGETEPTIPRDRRVLPFRRRTPASDSAPDADLEKFQRSGDGEDDYRHRMIVNVAAFVFVLALMGGAYWIADSMARMRKDQDCVLSGRSGCTPVEYSRERR
jgi:hypothetical protein